MVGADTRPSMSFTQLDPDSPLAAFDRYVASPSSSRSGKQSYDTGESTATNNGGDIHGQPLDAVPAGDHARVPASVSNPKIRGRRNGRQPSANTFLLHDAVATAQTASPNPRVRPSPKASRTANGAAERTTTPTSKSIPSGRAAASTSDSPQDTGTAASPVSPYRASPSTQVDGNDTAPSSAGRASFDVDSTQIVNMALNLSESRRIASSRRSASRMNPPALAPLPDPAGGSSLRQHFQQQRKLSRTGSPRPPQGSSPRIPFAAPRTTSPLRSAPFDIPQDGSYRWHFTPSTLSRAQKAKEQLELMAQYRRLLGMVPPLTPEHDQHLAGPSRDPSTALEDGQSSSQGMTANKGRPYNPLQYIRNRKVRARERMVIDGESQGFNDVDAVKVWLDSMAEQGLPSRRQGFDQTPIQMPTFPGAKEAEAQGLTDSSARTMARTRRPRVDWFFDPCDMIADAYWLEHDYHKHLVEDRQWRKIYPPAPQERRPASHHMDDANAGATPFSIKSLDETQIKEGQADLKPEPPAEDLVQVRTREKALQKLHDLKGTHHRHSSSNHAPHNLLRIRRNSVSDLSDSDTESKDHPVTTTRRARAGTLSSDTNDLLQKQMLEILAREANQRGATDVPQTVPEHTELPHASDHSVSSKAASRSHSRKGSIADALDLIKHPIAKVGITSPPRLHSGRPSLDLTDRTRRLSTDDDSSVPVSPHVESRDHAGASMSRATLSPSWSRSGSPTRNRLNKTATAGPGVQLSSHDEADSSPAVRTRRISLADPSSPEHRRLSLETDQRSPGRKLTPVATSDDAYKPYRGHSKESSIGIRGIFKGPSVLRGGVSKLGDMLWKKDGPSSESLDVDSTDESEGEPIRGRRRPTLTRRESKRQENKRPTSRHFFDAMPVFAHTADMQHRHGADPSSGQLPFQGSHSRQSSRFDLLKPPRLDVGGHSPSASPPFIIPDRRPWDSDASGSDARASRTSEGVQAADRRLSSIMGIPRLDPSERSRSQSWLAKEDSNANRGQMSRREIARVRALFLSSGIKALEIARRAQSPHRPVDEDLAPATTDCRNSIPWAAIARCSPDPTELYSHSHPRCELHPLAARHLGATIRTSAQRWQSSVDSFSQTTAPLLHRRLGALRSRVTDELSSATREAADLADETGKDLALVQPLRVRHVDDVIGKLLRKRRRRFRWTRRALWLGVEWTLVGFMWYVWFVVTVLRLVLGLGKGVVGGARWLLWL